MDSQEFNKLSKEEKKKVPFKELPKANKIAMIVVLSVFALLLFTCVGTCSHCSSGSSSSSGIDTSDIEITAKVLSESAVKSLLKAPSTAQFPSEEVRVFLIADSSVVIKGAVDAQNSFGAMLRSSYYVKLKWHNDYKNTDNWQILDAHLNE